MATLLEQGLPGFNTWVAASFAHYQYFGVPTLGQPPSQPGQVETVAPLRVENPFPFL